MSNNPNQPRIYAANIVEGWPLNKREAYFNSLGAREKQEREDLRNYLEALNRSYMRTSIQKKVPCQQTGASGYSQTWAAGSTLSFTVPTGLGQFCEGVRVDFTGTLNPATGTSAVYALNAASPFSLYNYWTVQYNGNLHRFRPYILPTIKRLMARYNPSALPSVLAGNSISWLQNWLSTGTTTFTVNTNNTWTFRIYLPFNLLPEPKMSAEGLIPTMGGETPLQINIECAATLVGYDPVTNLTSVVSGTGHAVTVTGTVAVVAYIRDGDQMLALAKRKLDIASIPTVQILEDQIYTGFSAGITYRPPLSIQDPMYYLIATFIDGVASTKFASNSNITVLGFSKDGTGTNAFWRYGTGTNMVVQEAFTQIRDQLEQDLEEGIFPYAWAPTQMERDPDDYSGVAIFNRKPNAWADARPEFQLTTVTTTNITPRVIFTAVTRNPAGLVMS